MRQIFRIRAYLSAFHEAISDLLDFMIHDGRDSEWGTVAIKLGMAYALMGEGQTLSLKSYENVQAIGLNDSWVAGILIFFAAIHGMALWINGRVRRTPMFRGICCFAGMIIFGTLAYATWSSPMVTNDLFPPVMLGLVFIELAGCRRAGDDHRCLMQRQ